MSAAPAPPPVPTAGTPATRPRGRRAIQAGIVMMVVAIMAIAASVGAWLLLGKTSTDGAELVSMPGSFSKDLTAGNWALYSEEVGGVQKTAYGDDVTIEGPGEVTKEETSGFYSDTTTIDFDGTTYQVFLRLDVPEDGTYNFDIAGNDPDQVPVVIGKYPNHDVLATVAVFTVIGSMLFGAVGLVLLIVGLVLRLTSRQKPTPPPDPTA